MLLFMAYFVSALADSYQILKSTAMSERSSKDRILGGLPARTSANIMSTGSYRRQPMTKKENDVDTV